MATAIHTQRAPLGEQTIDLGSDEAAVSGRYAGSRFADVWRAVSESPYERYPVKRVGARSAIELIRKNVYRSARRTLLRRDDLLADFDKLVHPVGICLRGTWQISERTPYTGYFRTGSKGLLIVRASDAMGEQRPGKLRFLGIAGKLYPTTHAEHSEPLETANFVMLENLGGSHTPHFVDATLSTDLLPLRPHPGLFWKIPAGLVAVPAFVLADRALRVTQPMIRQLYPIAKLGEPAESPFVAPTVMRLVGTAANRRVTTSELREELSMVHHPNGVRFEIQVADRRSYLYPRGFRRIGEVHFSESVASYAGDHRLHFAHAPYVRSHAQTRA